MRVYKGRKLEKYFSKEIFTIGYN